jgi:hypothetical protein
MAAPSGATPFVRAGASDPQGEALEGRLEIYEEVVQDVALADPAGEFSCDLGFLPEGVPGEGAIVAGVPDGILIRVLLGWTGGEATVVDGVSADPEAARRRPGSRPVSPPTGRAEVRGTGLACGRIYL